MTQRHGYQGFNGFDARADDALVTRIILAGVEVLARDFGSEPVIAVEVGCAVHPHAHLTTAAIASAVRRTHGARRFYSIDVDQDRLDESARVLSGFTGNLVAEVTPVCGDGAAALADVIDTEGRIDFACLDGSRDASLCLTEFDTILSALSPRGLVVVPGLEDLGAGGDMSAGWPLGRGSLILARLLADSASALRIPGNKPTEPADAVAFLVAGARDARVLVAGRPDTIDAFSADVRSLGVVCSDARTAAVRTGATPPALRPLDVTSVARAGRLAASMPRHDVDVHLHVSWRDQRAAFPSITPDDFASAVRAALHLEQRIIGRHGGDLAVRLSHYLAVAQVVRQAGGLTVDTLEIGTLSGGSCLMALMAMRDLGVTGTVTCIGPLTADEDGTRDRTSGVPASADTLYRNLESCGFGRDRIDLRACLGSDSAPPGELEPGRFGVVLIDGDHTLCGVGADWNSVSPLAAEWGLLLLDGYGEPAWPDVTAFADALAATAPDWRRAGCLGTTLVLCRRTNPLCVGFAEPQTDAGDENPVDLRSLVLDRGGAAGIDDIDPGVLARDLRAATQACPELGLARTAAGRADWDRAEDLFMMAATRAGVSPVITIEGWLGAADCRSARKDDRGSGELLRAAAAMEDRLRACGYHRVDALTRLARFVEEGTGQAEDGVRMCEEALHDADLSGPSRHELHVALGDIGLRSGAFASAVDHFAASLRIADLGPGREFLACVGRGLGLAGLGRQREAAAAFEHAIGLSARVSPPVPADRLCDAYLGWARALRHLKQHERAAGVCKAALGRGMMTPGGREAICRELDRTRKAAGIPAGANP